MQPNTPTQNPGSVVVSSAPFVSDHTPATPEHSHQSMSDMSSARRRLVRLLVIAVVVLAVVAAAFIGGFYVNRHIATTSQANATTTARQFVAYLNAGNDAKAYALASPATQKRLTEKQFEASLGDLAADKPSYLSQATTFSGQTAQYTLHEDGLPATTSGSTQGTFTLTLVKDGLLNWKVDVVTVE
ncbi:MAG TPA: hypothetical protein VLF40_03590 [Candidatus Saccharimonadales bacterium]|nr:hypothetical protein [Candidatus Saccharimonadales bacterium]